MKITIFGTGYVGLVSGACFAELGHSVMCIDIDKNKINNLKKGIIPIYEPELSELVKKHINKNIFFSTDALEGINFGKAIFNAVGTPPDKNNQDKADLKYVYKVAKTIGENIKEYKLIINKSTVPVGTGKECENIIKKEIFKRGKDIEFDVASNPEFLREGNAIYDFLNPDRIVCGVKNNKSRQILEEIYSPLSKKTLLIFTDITSAEIIKYASNAFLATKISFINEIANFAEIVGANINDISKRLGSDKRIGKDFLESGIGYGGSCFPKDIKALIQTGKEYNYDFKIISKTQEVNENQKTIVVKKLLQKINDISGKNICIWGLSFKPNTDDIRDAASIDVIQTLLKQNAKIKVYDPVSQENMKKIFDEKTIYYAKDPYDALSDCSALIILTNWNEFITSDIKKINKILIDKKTIIDGRNIFSNLDMLNLGFDYIGIGFKPKKHL